MFKTIVHAAFAAALSAAFAVAASAQDFQRSFPLPENGSIEVSTISGDITVTGYDGNAVVVMGYKSGPDADKVKIVDESTSNQVKIGVDYPNSRGAHRGFQADVRFEVKVPRGTQFRFDSINTISGDIAVDDVTGRVNTNSVSGNVKVAHIRGTVDANSVSGDINVDIAQLEGARSMKFNSVSGDVILRMPANLDASVDFTTLSGDIQSDFDIEIREEKYGPGKSARSRGGSRTVTGNTISGDIRLTRN